PRCEHYLTREVVATRNQERDWCRRSRGRLTHGRAHRARLAVRRRRGGSGMRRPISVIPGTGRGLLAAVMTNFDFAKIGVETTDEWITERTGIKQRYIASQGESTTTMAAAAARQAMQRANVSAGEIDAIVLSTATPDRLLPATAVDLQAELGATRAA